MKKLMFALLFLTNTLAFGMKDSNDESICSFSAIYIQAYSECLTPVGDPNGDYDPEALIKKGQSLKEIGKKENDESKQYIGSVLEEQGIKLKNNELSQEKLKSLVNEKKQLYKELCTDSQK